MFDPERDEEPGSRAYLLRLLTIAAVTIAGCVALWPSVHGFSTGADHTTGCLAITDGWHADRSGPSATEQATINAVIPPPPTAAQRADPAAMATWQVEWQAAQANPTVQRAFAYDDWVSGPGACVRASRHLLIHSGIALGALGLVVGGVAISRRTRTNLRPEPTQLVGT